MAEGFTAARAKKILTDNIKSTTYIGLSSTVPDKYGGNFSEPGSSTGYKRHTIGTFTASDDAQISNSEIIFFFEALADCGSFTHIGLFDDNKPETKPFFVGKLTTAITVGKGYVPLIRAGALVIGLDKEGSDA